MHRSEIIDGAAGMRTLTENEVAIVGGGWSIVDAICDVVRCISPVAAAAAAAGDVLAYASRT
jgi:hypothetical protein